MCVHVGGKSTPKCNEKDNFHKALPNVKKAYVTLRKFTPDLKIFYTDISAISVTLCNSDHHRFQWFSMVLDHWSNDAMVSMDRCGLVETSQTNASNVILPLLGQTI